ncbi:hypothetical protein BU23DRAFT_558033 [Bimuria novae-zelandiae CBS 107.79]|uniref:DUF7896 domain-containing protein n=1 Tax=Bimuria novae-zelandiae CBS 107.79 TaxID=1447943 RepID=A0A6A5UWC4_9PLEO|nr:hypothetical protein BU23DRAFT_558033 [Bimuria novae-zelandiae CBS 107.79]
MATALSSSIDQLKQAFCNQYAHLSEQQRQQLWLQTVATLPSNSPQQPSQSNQVPRSMSSSVTNMTQLLTNSYGNMDRVQSAPAAPAIEQTLSASSNTNLQRSNSTKSNWQSFDDQSNAYVFSDASYLRQQALQPIDETIFSDEAILEYSPADYVDNLIESSDSTHLPLSQAHHPSQLQLTPNNQWMPSLDASTSPSTPSTAPLMTPVTLSSNPMSRQSSFNPHFVDDVPMFRSDSAMYPLIPDDGSLSFSQDVSHVQKNISAPTDTLPFLSASGFTGLPSESSFLSPAPGSSASVHALASSQGNESCITEHMRRSSSASSSDESDASNASSSSLSRSRYVCREREIIAQAGRQIAPKAAPSLQTKSASPNAQMMRIQSEDGSSRQVGVISKAPYVRPQHPKILCPHCSERPEGFRGTHELERHVARAHTAVRKGYICVAPAFDKNFLSGCKHCRNKKVYGAYYNAAAHLRRAHFHPRKRGRKGKNDEKRGGIGGGDDPPMDYLKQNWIREIEVENVIKSSKSKRTPAESQSPESAGESVTENEVNAFDATYDPELAFPAPAQQSQQPSMGEPVAMTGMNGGAPYVDFNAYSSLSMTDASMYTALYASQAQQPTTTSDLSINDFEFDAYRT